MRGIFFIVPLVTLADAGDYREPLKAGHAKAHTHLESPANELEPEAKVVAIKAKPLKAQTTTKKITAVVEDDLPDTPEKSHLRAFTETKTLGQKNAADTEAKMTAADTEAKMTKSTPIKEHKAESPGTNKAAPKKLSAAKPVVTYATEEYMDSRSPVNQVALVNEANELAELEEEAASRALMMSETALANGGVTAEDNVNDQKYLRAVADHTAESLEDEPDNLYNESQGDLTQNEFANAQSSDWIADPSVDNSFVGVGGAWQKMKNLFGANKSSTKSSTSVVKSVTEVKTAAATAFKIPSQIVTRSDDGLIPDAASDFLEEEEDHGDSDEDDDGDDSATIVVPATSEDDE